MEEKYHLSKFKFLHFSALPSCDGAVELQPLSPLCHCLHIIDLRGKYGFCKLHGDYRYEEKGDISPVGNPLRDSTFCRICQAVCEHESSLWSVKTQMHVASWYTNPTVSHCPFVCSPTGNMYMDSRQSISSLMGPPGYPHMPPMSSTAPAMTGDSSITLFIGQEQEEI